MFDYGKKFKEVRIAKGFTLQEASSGVLTKSGLSKFERGETSLTFDKLKRILNNLSISIEEYDFYCRNTQLSDFDFFIEKVESAYITNNSILLKHLSDIEFTKYTETRSKIHKLNGIMVAILYENITNEQILKEKYIQFLTDYLFTLEQWFYYDIVLFGNSITKLPHNLIQSIYKDMVTKTDVFSKIPTHRKLIAQTLLNISIYYIQNKKIDYSEKSLKSSLFFIKQTDFQEKFLHTFLDRCLFFLESGKGEDNIINILNALKELVDDEIYVNYYDFFVNFIKNT